MEQSDFRSSAEDWGIRPPDTGVLPRSIKSKRGLFAARALITISLMALTIWAVPGSIEKALVLSFYIYGAVPYPYLFVRLVNKKNIYSHGHGNGGVANGFRVGGYLTGTLIVIGEVSKVAIPALISWSWFGFESDVTTLFMMASCIGVNFSLFMGLRGGMGVTIAMWSLLVLTPLSLVVILGVWAVYMVIIKDTLYQAMLAFATAPLVVLLVTMDPYLVAFTLLTAVLFCLRYDRSIDEFALAKRTGFRPRGQS